VSVLLLQLEVRPEITAYAARAGRGAGLTVVLDPAPAVPVPEQVWADLDIVTPNESEAAVITGIAVNDVITLGSLGAVVVEDSASLHFDPFPVSTVDTTAANDRASSVDAPAMPLSSRPTWASIPHDSPIIPAAGDPVFTETSSVQVTRHGRIGG
jgi:pfkB family carbohydrate kinase